MTRWKMSTRPTIARLGGTTEAAPTNPRAAGERSTTHRVAHRPKPMRKTVFRLRDRSRPTLSRRCRLILSFGRGVHGLFTFPAPSVPSGLEWFAFWGNAGAKALMAPAVSNPTRVSPHSFVKEPQRSTEVDQQHSLRCECCWSTPVSRETGSLLVRTRLGARRRARPAAKPTR